MQYRNVSVTDPEQFYTYWFEKNLQGDIVAIYNASGVKLITYAYDAWGKQIRTIHNSSGTNSYAQYNCLTYRGYFYDQETGLYYLNSRYYNPVTKRFINADGYTSTGQGLLGNNMFAYCGNNPISRTDPSGDFWITATIFTVLVVGCIALSGCSPQSDPEPYSGNANCYAYAMNLEYQPGTKKPFRTKPQPGDFSGISLTMYDMEGSPESVKERIEFRVSRDAKVLSLRFEEVYDTNYKTTPGNWLVALAYDDNSLGYHWYKRHDDGTWSHKPGTLPITKWDDSGNPIKDPAVCDRGKYNVFLGYYEVGPN